MMSDSRERKEVLDQGLDHGLLNLKWKSFFDNILVTENRQASENRENRYKKHKQASRQLVFIMRIQSMYNSLFAGKIEAVDKVVFC